MTLTTVTTKMCPRCGQIVSIHEYHKGLSKNDGMHTICKMCRQSLRITT